MFSKGIGESSLIALIQLIKNTTDSLETSVVWIGVSPPLLDKYVLWIDTSEDRLLYRRPGGSWSEISSSEGSSDVEYITDAEFEQMMKDIGI